LAKLEALSPIKFALEFDNTGFQIGRKEKEVHKICLATDVTDDVIEQAISGEADLLLTHHALIFKPLAQILADDIIGRRVLKLIRHDINYMSMHTNFDVIGMADYAADMLALSKRQVLMVTYIEKDVREGIGRFGTLPRPAALGECAETVKSSFNLDSVRVYGESSRIIKTAAVSPGSGSDALIYARKANVDLLITGDIKHSMALEALAYGIALIDAGHFGTEKIFVPYLKEYFEREMPTVEVIAAEEKNPFYVV